MDEYRLQTRGGKGVINVKTTARNGKVVSIMLVNEQSEVMVISQFGKIIRIDTKTFANPDAPPRACACCIWKKAIAWQQHRSSRRKKPWRTATARPVRWCSKKSNVKRL